MSIALGMVAGGRIGASRDTPEAVSRPLEDHQVIRDALFSGKMVILDGSDISEERYDTINLSDIAVPPPDDSIRRLEGSVTLEDNFRRQRCPVSLDFI